MKVKTVYLMLISTLSFAFVNAIIKYLDGYSEYQLVFFRCFISLIITFIQLSYFNISPWGNKKSVLFLRGLSGTVALFCGFVLIKNVPLGTAVMLNYLSPIFTAFIAVFWLKEKIKPQQWLYLLICIVGIYILKQGELSLTFNMLLLGLAASGLAGLAYNCVRICKQTDHPLVVVLYFPLVGAPMAFLGTIFLSNWVWPSFIHWLIIVLLGILTQIAQITLTKALQNDNAANATVLKYFGVIHAFLIGWVYFGEMVSGVSLLGASIVLVGIVLFSISSKRKATKVVIRNKNS